MGKKIKVTITTLIALILIGVLFANSFACNFGFMKKNNKSNKVKNVILMISDGAGYEHIDATSLYQYGKTGRQVYEKFPVKLGMSTYSVEGSYDKEKAWTDFDYVKQGATDSAAASTTMATGIKTYDGNETLLIVTADHECGYLTGTGSNPEYIPVVNNGKHKLPGMQWNSSNHTNSLIPIYVKGKNAKYFYNYVAGIDYKRNRYIDNSAVGNLIIEVIKKR